jgi:hypothetical protein
MNANALRCSDQSIALAKVLSAPKGVEAEILPPRALTVRRVGEGPRGNDDVIEVATTAEGRPPLKIPVLRLGSSPLESASVNLEERTRGQVGRPPGRSP